MYMGRQALCKGVGRPALWKWICAYKPFAYVNGHTSSLQIYMGRQALCKSIWAHKPFANLYEQTSPLQIYMGTQAICKCSNILRAHFMKTLRDHSERPLKEHLREHLREHQRERQERTPEKILTPLGECTRPTPLDVLLLFLNCVSCIDHEIEIWMYYTTVHIGRAEWKSQKVPFWFLVSANIATGSGGG